MTGPAATTDSPTRTLLRWLLGGALIAAGIGHLTAQREEFRAQVPDWLPIDDDIVVIGSGIVEVALGAALIGLPRHRVLVGTVVAAFFVVIFPATSRSGWRAPTPSASTPTPSGSLGCSSSRSW
jgi:uncharacterized membrane protein